MPLPLRFVLPVALALLAVPTARAQTDGRPRAEARREGRADTVEFKARGQRVQIVRAPGTDRQQRVEIRHGGDTLGVQLDVDPAMIDRWMRRIFVLEADTAEVRSGDDSLGLPLRIRLRTRRAPARPASDTTAALRLGSPLRDADGTILPARAGGLWVETLRDGERPGGDVAVLHETERPGGDVPTVRDGEPMRAAYVPVPTRLFRRDVSPRGEALPAAPVGLPSRRGPFWPGD